jgi:pimeloyl-ACP methyl ester carboxylesterase
MPFVRVNGINLFYEVDGAGDPLLLLAGFACDHNHWDLVKPALATHYRVISLDNRGVGRTDAPDNRDQPYTTRVMADDAMGLLRYLGIERTHVAGHSMGGQIAQELALAYPDAVRSLILLATWATPDSLFSSVIQSWGELPQLLDPGKKSFVRVVLPWVFTEAFFETPGAVAVSIATWVGSPPPATGLYGQSQAILASDTASRLSAISCPRLILVGRDDILTPVKFSQELARLIPGPDPEIIPHTGHHFVLESHAPVAQAMLNFLS